MDFAGKCLSLGIDTWRLYMGNLNFQVFHELESHTYTGRDEDGDWLLFGDTGKHHLFWVPSQNIVISNIGSSTVPGWVPTPYLHPLTPKEQASLDLARRIQELQRQWV